jgi:hypothetical protein
VVGRDNTSNAIKEEIIMWGYKKGFNSLTLEEVEDASGS